MRLLHSLLAATALIGLTLTAHADTYANYTVTGGTFASSNDTFSGTFTFDKTTNLITAASITVIDPTSPTVFNVLVPENSYYYLGDTYSTLNDTSGDRFTLNLTTGAAGLCLDTTYGCSRSDFTIPPINQIVVHSATVTLVPAAVAATPEPSSLILLGTGVLGLAGATRRRLLNR